MDCIAGWGLDRGILDGMLWLAHATTRDQKYLDWAERWTDLLRPRARSENIFRSFLFYYGAALGDILVGNSQVREVGLLGAEGWLLSTTPTRGQFPLAVRPRPSQR